MYRSYTKLWQLKLQSTSRLVPNCTNYFRFFTVIKGNCVQATCECLNYIKAIRYSARIARISIQIDREINLIHLGTELQEQYQISTVIPCDSPYGSSIRGYHRTPLSETMPRPSVDHQSWLPIVGNVSSTNLDI
jgi:hypothetical protein